MAKPLNRRLLVVVMLMMFGAPSLAQDDDSLRKDLTSVIALLGLSCGEVIKVTRLGEDNNLAHCKDGNRYRVYINEQGRVVAEKQ